MTLFCDSGSVDMCRSAGAGELRSWLGLVKVDFSRHSLVKPVKKKLNGFSPNVQRQMLKTNQMSNQILGFWIFRNQIPNQLVSLKFQSNQIEYFDVSEMISSLMFYQIKGFIKYYGSTLTQIKVQDKCQGFHLYQIKVQIK